MYAGKHSTTELHLQPCGTSWNLPLIVFISPHNWSSIPLKMSPPCFRVSTCRSLWDSGCSHEHHWHDTCYPCREKKVCLFSRPWTSFLHCPDSDLTMLKLLQREAASLKETCSEVRGGELGTQRKSVPMKPRKSLWKGGLRRREWGVDGKGRETEKIGSTSFNSASPHWLLYHF